MPDTNQVSIFNDIELSLIKNSFADNDSGGRGGDFVTTGFGASSMRVVRRSVFMGVDDLRSVVHLTCVPSTARAIRSSVR